MYLYITIEIMFRIMKINKYEKGFVEVMPNFPNADTNIPIWIK